ncbi:MAG: hypothetical protein Q9201_003898 [Fulgogasparrea decipioides]
MSKKAERRRHVFLTARTVFVGPNAQIRDRKAIAAIVARHESTFQPLCQKFKTSRVIDITLSLLENRIFESELNTKLAFPELYQVSAARNLQHDLSEQHAARSEAEALEAVSLAHDKGERNDSDDQDDNSAGEQKVGQIIDDPTRKLLPDVPSLYPAYVLFEVQHKLLNTVQSLLEQCCYDWAKQWLPSVLNDRKWTCAEAVELTKWVKVIPHGKLPADATALDSKTDLRPILNATHELRHAAVHRLPTSAKGIDKMLRNALSLATALHDTSTGFKIEQLVLDFQGCLKDMQLHKNHLENELDEELRDIHRQRAALEQREKDAKATMVQQDHDNTTKLSRLFEESLTKLTSAQRTNQEGEIPPTSADKEVNSVVEDSAQDIRPSDDENKLRKSIHDRDDLEVNGANDEVIDLYDRSLTNIKL